MFRKLRSGIFAAALMAFLFLCSANAIYAFIAFSCVGGQLYVTTLNSQTGKLETRLDGAACSGGTVIIYEKVTPGVTGASVKDSPTGQRYLELSKRGSLKTLKILDSGSEINDRILGDLIDPKKNEVLTYQKGELPDYIEKLAGNGNAVIMSNIHVEWGRRRMQCHGAGICIFNPDPGPHCPADSARTKSGDRSITAAGIINDKKLTLFIQAPIPELPEKGGSIYVDEDISVSKCACEGLGLKSLTILKGEYKLVSERSKISQVILNIETVKSDSVPQKGGSIKR